MVEEHPEMLYRPLGRAGEKVSALGVGGFHLAGQIDERLAVRIVREAVDHGVTFMDNCWDYNEGASELRMGKALRDGYRDRVFLMTKIDGRSKKDAAAQLDESLRRLQTDHIDLVQHHEVIRVRRPASHLRRAGRARGAARRPGRPASCATSGSPATRTRISTCTCWTSPPSAGSTSMPSRCR